MNSVKSGRARGGEAVLLVENIRSYYDILPATKPSYTAAFSAHGRHDRHAGQQPGPQAQALSASSPPM
jgi:membrane-bound lytic murein transglycosylase F